MGRAEPDRLLERDYELSSLESALDAAARGAGRVLAVEGPAGIGKSRLLAEMRTRARERGMLVLSARGAELETGFAFGIVRQLLEPALAAAAPEERERWLSGAAQLAAPVFEAAPATETAGEREGGYPRLHGLYWLCANIARERPALVAVDDLQWGDGASLAFLGFLARRLEALGLVLAVALRPERPSDAVVHLLADPLADVLRPLELSREALALWISEVAGAAPEPEFADACHAATGGNPLLMRELLQETLAEGLEPTARNAGRVRSLGPRGVSTVVLRRLARLPSGTLAVARAAALLGDRATLEDAAALAGVAFEDARAAAAALVDACLLQDAESLCFVHPIVRRAIVDDMPALERASRHAIAAELLHRRGAAAEEVAAHVLAGQPADAADWAPATLREAAGRARALGDPQAAVRYLRRALELRAAGPVRGELLAELGVAEGLAGDERSVEHLREAIRAEGSAERRVEWARALGDLLKFAGDAIAAADVLEAATEGLPPDSPLHDAVHAELAGVGFISAAGRERVGDRVRSLRLATGVAETGAERLALACAAFEEAANGGDAARAAELARRALAGRGARGRHFVTDQLYVLATAALTFCEDLEEADRVNTQALAAARREGSAMAVAAASALRSMCRFRMGRVAEAEADALASLDLAADVHAAATLSPVALASAIHAAVERNADADAFAALEGALQLDDDLLPVSLVHQARGAFHAARGRLDEALACYLMGDRAVPGWGRDSPALIPWRSNAARVLRARGDDAAAAELAAEELRLARAFGTPRAVGIALRAAGLVAAGSRRRELLAEAVDRLATSHDRLEHARALIDLGAELRRGGARRTARRPLEDGMRMAGRAGSDREVARAREELAASGVRVQRGPAVGVAALTPSERRVAEMAAEGLTNREIAQALFVSEKTVETHLSRVYGKLGIGSRRELSPALAA